MAFVPQYTHEEVEAKVAAGGLTRREIYRLKHQHPLNRLTHVFGIPLVWLSLFWIPITWFGWGYVGWQGMLGIGAAGWCFQFLGHAIEGNRPAFFNDPMQMLVGPLYFLLAPFRALRGRSRENAAEE